VFHEFTFATLGGLPLGGLIVLAELDCSLSASMLLFLMFWSSFGAIEPVEVSLSVSSAIRTMSVSSAIRTKKRYYEDRAYMILDLLKLSQSCTLHNCLNQSSPSYISFPLCKKGSIYIH
jgi:hypothetical protein